jgi:hypothetical protein
MSDFDIPPKTTKTIRLERIGNLAAGQSIASLMPESLEALQRTCPVGQIISFRVTLFAVSKDA